MEEKIVSNICRVTRKKIIVALLLVLLVAYAVIAVLPRPENFKGENQMMKDGELPILIAHGGGNREFRIIRLKRSVMLTALIKEL